MGDYPVEVKFDCKEVDPPPAETAELYRFRLMTPEP